jgi:hypothetical protein
MDEHGKCRNGRSLSRVHNRWVGVLIPRIETRQCAGIYQRGDALLLLISMWAFIESGHGDNGHGSTLRRDITANFGGRSFAERYLRQGACGQGIGWVFDDGNTTLSG